MARRNFGGGALRLIGPTTSTGYGLAASIEPVRLISAQIVGGGAGSFLVEGSIDGEAWTEVMSATSFLSTGMVGGDVTKTSTSLHLLTQLRASFTVNSSTVESSLFVVGI